MQRGLELRQKAKREEKEKQDELGRSSRQLNTDDGGKRMQDLSNGVLHKLAFDEELSSKQAEEEAAAARVIPYFFLP